MTEKTPIQVYQLGREIPVLIRPLIKRALHSHSIRNLLVPEHALIFDRGMYRGRGEHIPGCMTLMLAHDYGTRNVEQDFPFIDAALIALEHSDKESVTIRFAKGNEPGLEELQARFNIYRAMRGVHPDVQWEAA